MCIASVDGECHDSARTRSEIKMSKTEGVSPRFARSRYAGGFRCENGMTAPQQMLEIAKERGLALVQTEERHGSATNQMELSTISTESEMMVKWLLSWIGWYQTYAAGMLKRGWTCRVSMRIAVVCLYHPRWYRGVSILRDQSLQDIAQVR